MMITVANVAMMIGLWLYGHCGTYRDCDGGSDNIHDNDCIVIMMMKEEIMIHVHSGIVVMMMREVTIINDNVDIMVMMKEIIMIHDHSSIVIMMMK